MTGEYRDPRSPAEWDAYRALPEWEVTVRLYRTARFRVHAATAEEAAARLLSGANGVRSMQDLHDEDMDIEAVTGVEAVDGDVP